MLKNLGLDDIIALNNCKKYLELRNKDNFEGLTNKQIQDIKNSKCGYISISKKSNNPGYLISGEKREGWCAIFGEGLSCIIFGHGGKLYYTSNITHIDWDNNEFNTLNSIYSFKLDEYDSNELLNFLNNESKNNEPQSKSAS